MKGYVQLKSPAAPRSGPAPADGEQIRVCIVDDHPIVREGLVAMVQQEPDFLVCGEAGDPAAAIEQFDQIRPDVMLVDLNLAGASGVEVLRHIQRNWIGARTIVVSQHEPAIHAPRVREAGASGYVHKQESVEQLADAIRKVFHGQTFFPNLDQ